MKKTSDGKYVGSKKTQERVDAELKEKRENEEWRKETKEREEGWERQREERDARMKKSGWGRVVGYEKEKSGGGAVEWSKDASRWQEGETSQEEDNIRETRFETTEEYGPLQPSPPHIRCPRGTASAASELRK